MHLYIQWPELYKDIKKQLKTWEFVKLSINFNSRPLDPQVWPTHECITNPIYGRIRRRHMHIDHIVASKR